MDRDSPARAKRPGMRRPRGIISTPPSWSSAFLPAGKGPPSGRRQPCLFNLDAGSRMTCSPKLQSTDIFPNDPERILVSGRPVSDFIALLVSRRTVAARMNPALTTVVFSIFPIAVFPLPFTLQR